jgi:hypothetical protein
MTQFIELIGADNDKPMHFNVEHIVTVEHPPTTEVNTHAKAYVRVVSGGIAVVQETPSYIMSCIQP